MLTALRQLFPRRRPGPVSAEQRAALIELNLLEHNLAYAEQRLKANAGFGTVELLSFVSQSCACLETARSATSPRPEEWARWHRLALRLNTHFDAQSQATAAMKGNDSG